MSSVGESRPASVQVSKFGNLPDGRAVHIFTLTNKHGREVRVMDYGATVLSIRVPDRDGNVGDVVLGHDDLEGYLDVRSFFGATVGRFGNRIAGARFELDGQEYQLAANNGPNHLHGGNVGFDQVLWSRSSTHESEGAGVTLGYVSADREEGYPGRLEVEVDYFLNDANELVIEYRARSDKATPVNLTHHSYFNLAGFGNVLDHRLEIAAAGYTPADETLIPTGTVETVVGTPFDFLEPTPIGARIDSAHPQIAIGNGYDHNFVLERPDSGSSISDDGELADLSFAARVTEPGSGRVLEVATTEPGLQFYSGNFLDGKTLGKDGVAYGQRSGFCLESQHYPDSPNQPGFPSVILRPDQQYRSRTLYRFSASAGESGQLPDE
jgi:aldose 1-epimerase